MAKRKNLIKVLATLGVSALVAGAGVSTLSAGATAEKTVAGKGVDSFQMVYGASVRCGDGVENGIRFSATISDDEYKALEKLEETSGVSVNYGVLIVPADMFAEADLTEANIFQNANYCLENCERGCSKTHLATVEYATLADDSATDEVMNLRGSLIRIKEDNINREFVGLAYIEYENANDPTQNEYEFANYALPVDENNNPIAEGVRELANTTRSMTYVAQRAIVKNEVDATTAQTLASDYIAPLANYDFKYYVNHHLDSDTVVTETLYGKLNSEVTAQHIAKTNPTEYSHYATYGASADSNTSDIVYANGRTVLNYYYDTNATKLFDGSADATYLANVNTLATVSTVTVDPATNETVDGLTKLEFSGDQYGAGYLKLALPDERIENANQANWDYLVVRMYVEAKNTTKTSIDMFSWNLNLGSIPLNTWVDFVVPKALLNNPYSYVINSKGASKLSKTAFDDKFLACYGASNTPKNFFYTNSLTEKKNSDGTYTKTDGLVTYYIDSIHYGMDVNAPKIKSISKAYAGSWTPEIVIQDDIIPNTTWGANSWGPNSSYVLYVEENGVRNEMTAQDGSYTIEKGKKYILSVTANDGNATDVTGNVYTEDVEIYVYDDNELVNVSKYSPMELLAKEHLLGEDSVMPTISFVDNYAGVDGVWKYESKAHTGQTYGGYFYLNLREEEINKVINAFNNSTDFTLKIKMLVEVSNPAKNAVVSLCDGKKYMNAGDNLAIGEWITVELTKEDLIANMWKTNDALRKTLTGESQFCYLGYPTCGVDTSIIYYIDSITYSATINA